MRIDAVLDLGLVACFVLLAVAEVRAGHSRASSEPVGDARLITNFGLGVLVLASNALLPLAKIGSSVLGQTVSPGLAERFAWPWALAFAALVLIDSFVAYWAHRAMHAVPILWRIHRVHHSDSSVDVSTSLRHHPLELLVTFPASAAVIVAIGAPVSAVVTSQALMFGASIWQHADIQWPGIDRILGPWLITPLMHRLHHSPQRFQHDSNYGELISLWDRLFGTFRPGEGRGRVGLENQVAHADHLLEQIWSPVHA